MDLSSGKLRWLRVSTLVAGVAVLVSACGTSQNATGDNIKNGGTLIWALDADAQSLNPFVAGDVPSVRAYGFLFPNLYQADKNLNVIPDLADGMPSISADKKVWTVKLRKDAKWSDGSPITADDVVMTVNMQNNPNLDTDAAFDWGELDNVAKVEADWFRRTGIYPIHGLIVVKTAVLEQHPEVARSLYDAFVESKKPYIDHLKGSENTFPEDAKYRGLMPIVGDPLPYGLKDNMPSIEAMLTYGLQQGLIPKRMPMDEVFVDPAKA